MDKDDLILKVANFLRRQVSFQPNYFRFALIAITIDEPGREAEVKENLAEAAAKADVEIMEKTDDRALLRRRSSQPPPKKRDLDEG